MANETLGVTTEPSPDKSFIGYICAVALDILKFEQISLFYSTSYLNSGGLELCFGGAKPIKDPRGYGTVWQSFSLLFNAIDSQKHLGYVICQACKICQNFCL